MSYNLLKGKRGIIFGALNEKSIAWKVAEKAHEEGAKFVLTNAPIAMRMGEINKLAAATSSKVIPADATSVADLEKLYIESMQELNEVIKEKLLWKNAAEFLGIAVEEKHNRGK